jgi:hypothetical protein
MWDLIKKLPKEILYLKIIPLSYNIQPSSLLLDIKNFYETKKIISNLYYIKYKYLLDNEINADKYWLINDIILFIKFNKTYDQFKILYILYNKFCIINKCPKIQFNIFWSKLNIIERNNFILIMDK